MAAPVDLIAIARDIVQETCLGFPIIPTRISERRVVFIAASTVKEMCDTAIDDGLVDYEEDAGPAQAEFEHDVANLILYNALIVEYMANFLGKYSPSQMSESNMRVLDTFENVKDILTCIQPGVSVDTYKSELIDAVARDLQLDKVRVSQSIEQSFQRHSCCPQEAEDFIQRNRNWDRHEPINIKNLTDFLNEDSVSLFALRDEYAVTFLDILEQATRSDSVATQREKRLYQTCLRRLSCRSELLPRAFHLQDVKPIPCSLNHCDHCNIGKIPRSGPLPSLTGGFGIVRIAEWTKPDGKVVKVATKTAMNGDRAMLCHEAAFWNYLDANKVVPFYGIADVENSLYLVSLWMDGGRICCYVDKRKDSIRLDLLRQVANGIKYLHDLNLVHCDIKPENILIDTQQPKQPRALITDFKSTNSAAGRTNVVAYTQPFCYTDGYVSRNNDVTAWDPSNDVYAFGVTCCQVILVNKRRGIASIPQDIKICVSKRWSLSAESSDGEGNNDSRQQIIQALCQKFFPDDRSHSSSVHEICRLAAFTCGTPPCNLDYVIDLLESACGSLGLKSDTQ